MTKDAESQGKNLYKGKRKVVQTRGANRKQAIKRLATKGQPMF